MYKIKEMHLEGFFGDKKAYCQFFDDVTIIVGRNGEGKTSFINYLFAALSVDVEWLIENSIDKIELKLVCGKSTKKIVVQFLHRVIQYKVSRTVFKFPVEYFSRRKSFIPSQFKSELNELRSMLREFVSLSSLSVYRSEYIGEFESNDSKYKNAIDKRLSELKFQLTEFLSNKRKSENEESKNLQRQALLSILGEPTKSKVFNSILNQDDDESQKEKLISAYKQLQISEDKVSRAVATHFNTLSQIQMKLKDKQPLNLRDMYTLIVNWQSKEIVEMSLSSQQKINEIYNGVQSFEKIINTDFFFDKFIELNTGTIVVKRKIDEKILEITRLSSGEKQLLILLIQSLLKEDSLFTYITDEPELSLHVEWQRNIVPSIQLLNPNAQIILATHSPEIASKYCDKIISMKEICSFK